jgi:hypothetical protein
MGGYYMSRRFLFFLLILPISIFAATGGSKSLWHVQMARTLNPGRLELRTDMNFYTKVGDYLGQNKPADFKAVNYWDVQGNALLTYGIMKHLDASLRIKTYQDVHSEKEANIPGDIFLGIKAGGWTVGTPNMSAALLLDIQFPTGDVRNYPFEEYASPSVAPQVGFALSYFKDPYLPERDLSFHLNLGYKMYFDAGKVIKKVGNTEYLAGDHDPDGGNTAAFKYGVAFVWPTDLFDISLELHGNVFTNEPDSAVYSRENFTYITPGVKIKPFAWMAFKMGIDLRVSGDENSSLPVATMGGANIDLPNYFKWKFRMGVDVTLMPLVTYTKSRTEVEKEELGRRVEFFEEIIKERQKAEKIEEELERLRQQREEAERELEELRQLLEETGPTD